MTAPASRSAPAMVLITGGSGLLGRHVLQDWAVPAYQAVTVDHREHDLLVPGTGTALLDQVRPAAVLHLAWSASGNANYRTSAENDRWVEASLELAAACARSGVRFVGTGTALDLSDQAPDAYAAAKARLRRELTTAIDARQISWLRPYYVVDPERRRPAVVDQALTAVAQSAEMILRTPDSKHDYVHAGDVGQAVQLVLSREMMGEVPIGGGRLRMVRELVQALGAQWRAESPKPGAAGPAQEHNVADIRRLVEQGWSPHQTEELFRS